LHHALRQKNAGVRLLSVRPWRPVPAQDKLSSGLALMTDCGLIAPKELDNQ